MTTVQEILDADIPDPTWTFAPGYGKPLPSEVTTFDRGSQRRTLGQDAQFKNVAAGAQRIYGPKQGLAASIHAVTNEQLDSSNFGNWGENGATVTDNTLTSLIAEENAARVEGGGNYKDAISAGFAAPYSSSEEFIYGIFEKGTSAKFRISWRENNNYNALGTLTYEWGADNPLNTSSSVIYGMSHVLFEEGPNGNKVLIIGGRYDPTDINGNDYSGNDGQSFIWPDVTESGNDTICHHMQNTKGENQNAFALPIVTDGTSNSVNGETLKGELPDSFNTDTGTFIMEVMMPRGRGGGKYDYSDFFAQQGGGSHFGTEGNTMVVRGGNLRIKHSRFHPLVPSRLGFSIDQAGRNVAHWVTSNPIDGQEASTETSPGNFLEGLTNGWELGGGSWVIYQINYSPQYTPVSELKKVI